MFLRPQLSRAPPFPIVTFSSPPLRKCRIRLIEEPALFSLPLREIPSTRGNAYLTLVSPTASSLSRPRTNPFRTLSTASVLKAPVVSPRLLLTGETRFFREESRAASNRPST